MWLYQLILHFFYHYVQFIVTAAMLVGGESHRIYFLTGSFGPNFVHICPVMSEKIFEKLTDKSKIFRQFCCTVKISLLLQTMQQLEYNFLFSYFVLWAFKTMIIILMYLKDIVRSTWVHPRFLVGFVLLDLSLYMYVL